LKEEVASRRNRSAGGVTAIFPTTGRWRNWPLEFFGKRDESYDQDIFLGDHSNTFLASFGVFISAFLN